MRSSKNTLPSLTRVLLFLGMGVSLVCAQYIDVEIARRPVYQPAYYITAGLPRLFADWHDTLADLDEIFSALDTRPTSTVKLHEQLKTDSNQTAHLYLSVRLHHLCKGESRCNAETTIDLTNVKVSILEDLLAVTANTTHGAFSRNYKLPEHALTQNITAVYSSSMVLHIVCPTLVPPRPEPRFLDIHVEPAPEAQPSAASPLRTPLHDKTNANSSAPAEDAQASIPADSADEPRQDVLKYIKTLEADLARLKNMM
jgi:hypothetical protein